MTRSRVTGSWPVAAAVVLCAVATLIVALAGCGAGPSVVGAHAVRTQSEAPRTSQASQQATVQAPLPLSVRIPSIDASSTLVQLGQNPDGTVQVPPVSTPMQAGWYIGSSVPGAAGPAVLLGHVDGDRQAGIFFRLHELVPGAAVQITRADGSVLTFTVTKVDQVSKSAFPTDAVYGPTSDPELRLLTCGGAFDQAAHSYVDNVIVYAKLVT
jgi:sortase (surface protein transpeptidase)